MIYMARCKPTFKSDRKMRMCHCIAMQRASWKCMRKIAGSVHRGISWLCFWKKIVCVCVLLRYHKNKEIHLCGGITEINTGGFWSAKWDVMEGITALHTKTNETMIIFNCYFPLCFCLHGNWRGITVIDSGPQRIMCVCVCVCGFLVSAYPLYPCTPFHRK